MNRKTILSAGLLSSALVWGVEPVFVQSTVDDFKGTDTSAANGQWDVTKHANTRVHTAAIILGGGLKTLEQVADSETLPLLDSTRQGLVIICR